MREDLAALEAAVAAGSASASMRVTRLPAIATNSRAMSELHDGLANAVAVAQLDMPELEDEGDDDLRWDQLVDEVIDEMAPDIAIRLEESIAGHLPWEVGSDGTGSNSR